MPERLGWRPTGDIRLFPRKDKLLKGVRENVLSSTECRSVDKVLVHGSWARGEAVPFASDIDFIAEVDRLPAPTVAPGQSTPPTGQYMFKYYTDTDFVWFNGIDIWLSLSEGGFNGLKENPDIQDMFLDEEPTDENIEKRIGIMKTGDLVRALSQDRPPVVYDLDRKNMVGY